MVRHIKPPFLINLGPIQKRMQLLPSRVDGVAIRLPFLSINVKTDDVERKAAREIVVRLADRRVLNAFECCDDCIDKALASLQDIRRLLVDQQVAISDHVDGPLYLLLDAMLEALRQFFTFEQRLGRSPESRPVYFAALEMLRGHLFRCLSQVSAIGDIAIPRISEHMRYDGEWQLEAYAPLELPPATPDSGSPAN